MPMSDTAWGDMLMQHMQGGNDTTAKGYSSGGSRNGGSIYVPSYLALQQMCSPSSPNPYGVGQGTLPSTFSALVPWLWCWEGVNNAASNTRLILGAMHAEVLRSDTDEWEVVFTNAQPKGWVNSGVYSDSGDAGDQIQLSDGLYASVKPTQSKPLELWTNPFFNHSRRDLMVQMKAAHFRAWFWLEGSDIGAAEYMLDQGFDPYEAYSSQPGNKRPPDDFPYRAQDGGHSRFIKATATPQLITCTTVGPTAVAPGGRPPWVSNYGDGAAWIWGTVATGYLLSESQLRANLPSKPPDEPPTSSSVPVPPPAPAPGPAPVPAPSPLQGPNKLPTYAVWQTRFDEPETRAVWLPRDAGVVTEPPTGGGTGSVTSVEISPTSVLLTSIGQSSQLTPTVTVVGGASTSVTYSKTGAAVSVNGAGLVTAEALGVATVKVTSVADPTKFALVQCVVNPAPAGVKVPGSAWGKKLSGQ